MELEVLPDGESVARRGAELVAAAARLAVERSGRFVIAVSGGTTPWHMLRALANEQVPWDGFHVVQVDERVAPDNHSDRNLTHLRRALRVCARLREDQIHAMPVGDPDLDAAAASYGRTLETLFGTAPVLDMAHLGLGTDGHTASLVLDDPALGVVDADVAATGVYQGRRRLTLTYPILNRARQRLWLVTGAAKCEMLQRLRDGDPTIPAGRINPASATILADRGAVPLDGKTD